MNQNIYAERDHESLGEHYMRHIDRMTVEDLNSKSAIAGELAYRDKKIEKLEAQLIAESSRTANEKLRADHMTKRLDMCNRLRATETNLPL